MTAFVSSGSFHPEIEQAVNDTEEALRVMAAESRFRRGMLTDALGEMFEISRRNDPRRRYARVVVSPDQPGPGYIFLMAPKAETESYEDYRRFRVGLLHAYCIAAKRKFPQTTIFIGIGLDHPGKNYEGSSEDIIVHQDVVLTPEEEVQALEYLQEQRILGDSTVFSTRYTTEFPTEPRSRAELRATKKPPSGKDKRKSKRANASRRRNRK
jgi:hypothetical protein